MIHHGTSLTHERKPNDIKVNSNIIARFNLRNANFIECSVKKAWKIRIGRTLQRLIPKDAMLTLLKELEKYPTNQELLSSFRSKLNNEI